MATFIESDRGYLEIKVCKTGAMVYQHDAYDTVTRWDLEEHSIISFNCSLNEPPELLEVLKVKPRRGDRKGVERR